MKQWSEMQERPEAQREDMPEDLEWLARNVSEWPKERSGTSEFYARRFAGADFDSIPTHIKKWTADDDAWYTRAQWQTARQRLGLDPTPEQEPMPEEEEELPAKDLRNLFDEIMEGFDCLQECREESAEIFTATYHATEAASSDQARGKYHVQIKPGVWVDVYDVLSAYAVTNQATAHAIKKLLMPGRRGHKDAATDLREAIVSLERAVELEGLR